MNRGKGEWLEGNGGGEQEEAIHRLARATG